MRAVLALLLFGAVAGSSFGITLDDCLALKSYYLEKPSVVEGRIAEFDAILNATPRDSYAYLAKCFLLTILANADDEPHPALAKRLTDASAQFLAREPGNAFGLIYQAVSLGYSAKCNGNFFEQVHLIGQCISLYDKAVVRLANTKYEYFAHAMRGSSYAQFPATLGKRDVAMADLRWVEKAYAANPDLLGEAIVACYYLGELSDAAGRRDQAAAYWRKAAALNQGSPLKEGRLAEERVRRLS